MLNGNIPFAYAKSKHFECDLFEIIDGRHSRRERHGNCDTPIELVSWGSREADLPGHDLYEQVTTVRCRKCEGCRRYRVAKVVNVCGKLADQASRTKFVTLTVDDRWNEKSDAFFVAEMQRYLKRVRAVAPPFKYAWVKERQRRGAPHAHIMIFEGQDPVLNYHLRGRHLKGNGLWKPRWTWGFMHIEIADTASNAAWYLIKYLGKDPGARIRRSVDRQQRKSPQR